MAGPKKWTEELIADRVKAGRGRGTGKNYSPWLTVQEFSSRGTQTRVPSPKLKRTVHTFSYMERSLFLVTEFLPAFVDFQEQYPLDRSITLGAARVLDIQHPRYPRTATPLVMTMDALVTLRGPDGHEQLAGWDVKPARHLLNPRVLAKLSLHRAFCNHIGIPHHLFTEASIPRDVVRNIDWIRMALPKDGELEVVQGLFTVHPAQLLSELAACRTRPTISHFCSQYDKAHKLPLGTGLRVFKLLLWEHRIGVDFSARRIELEPIPQAPWSTSPGITTAPAPVTSLPSVGTPTLATLQVHPTEVVLPLTTSPAKKVA